MAEDLPIELVMIGSRAALGKLGLPWYLGMDGTECGFDVVGARRIHVAEVSQLLAGPLNHRAGAIEEKVERLVGMDAPIRLRMPAYRRGEERILLDGCHTAAALMGVKADFEVQLFAISGPDDAEYLIDLAVR